MESLHISLVLLSIVLSCSLCAAALSQCPCEDASLCRPLSTASPDKEVLGFVVSQHNWSKYNWTHLTTLAMFANLSSNLLCHAHSKNVRVVLNGSYPIAELSNKTERATWIQTQLQRVQESFADGLNLDISDPTRNGTNDSILLTKFVNETYVAFKAANKAYQISLNVPWSPNCIDGRCYQFDKLADITDFLIITAYNEQSQIFGSCVAKANSGFKTTALGLLDYLKMGIAPGNLVLGLPWYGYDYPCESLSDDDVCTIEKVPFRGVNCSDAAGTQVSYSHIRQLINNSSATVRMSTPSISPYFNYKHNNQTHQVWFDNPDSLSLKYMLSRKQGLKGVAFWNLDSLDYSSTDSKSLALNAEMWSAVDILGF